MEMESVRTEQTGAEEHVSSQTSEPGRPQRTHGRRFSKRTRAALRFVLQMLVLVAVYCLGSALSSVLPISLPGNILGMVLLLILLAIGVIKIHHVNMACEFMLDNMSFFFIPAGVAVMGCFSLLADNALKFLFICIITTMLTFCATSYTVVSVSRFMAQRASRKLEEGSEEQR
jgi:holin-like protein